MFLGDYVDRGKYGPEVVAYLFALKIRYPDMVHLLRGNHETRECTTDYNFREQMISQFDEEAYDAVIEAFQQLPLAAIVNGQYLALHGGVSSRLKTFEQINEIERKAEPEVDESLFNDLLWADPLKSRLANNIGEIENEERGISVKFGWPILKDLLDQANLRCLIRAHQQKDDGYKLHMWKGKGNDPPCITIFSAPNYCGHQNPASIFVTDFDHSQKVLVYEEYPVRQYFLPDWTTNEYPTEPYDIFRWFMPCMREWITQFFNTVISKINDKSESLEPSYSVETLEPSNLTPTV